MVEMKKSGRIDKEDAHYFLDEIEVQMNELLNKPLDFILPDAKDLIKDIKLFSELDEKIIVSIIPFVEIKIFPFNYQFNQELDPKNGLGVICRGSAKISNKQDDNRSAVLAKGDIISDKTVQKGDRLISETPLTVMWIPSSKIDQVKSLSPVFKDII